MSTSRVAMTREGSDHLIMGVLTDDTLYGDRFQAIA